MTITLLLFCLCSILTLPINTHILLEEIVGKHIAILEKTTYILDLVLYFCITIMTLLHFYSFIIELYCHIYVCSIYFTFLTFHIHISSLEFLLFVFSDIDYL